ncbi:MAG: hypothetical protein IJ561_03870 [Ruminococcus sp.]|nr:hypothetical protein [Ruminococcus sp.]
MLVLIDDIKLRTERDFVPYVDTLFHNESINSLGDLTQLLLTTDEEIEFLVSDYDTIEDKEFASKVMKMLIDVSSARSNIKLTQM